MGFDEWLVSFLVRVACAGVLVKELDFFSLEYNEVPSREF